MPIPVTINGNNRRGSISNPSASRSRHSASRPRHSASRPKVNPSASRRLPPLSESTGNKWNPLNLNGHGTRTSIPKPIRSTSPYMRPKTLQQTANEYNTILQYMGFGTRNQRNNYQKVMRINGEPAKNFTSDSFYDKPKKKKLLYLMQPFGIKI